MLVAKTQRPLHTCPTRPQVCSDPSQSGYAPMLYQTSVWVQQNLNTSAVGYLEAGKATLWMRRNGRVTLTVQMSCPWMIWSSPTSPGSASDFDLDANQKFQVTYQTQWATSTTPQYMELNLRRKWGYARTSNYYSW